MTKTNWKLTEKIATGPTTRLVLARGDQTAMLAVATGQHLIVATFGGRRARANAAGLLACVLDQVDDLSDDVPLIVDATLTDDACVTVTGPDAVLAVASSFGGDYGTGNAADAILEALS